jgi:hypothetical protein
MVVEMVAGPPDELGNGLLKLRRPGDQRRGGRTGDAPAPGPQASDTRTPCRSTLSTADARGLVVEADDAPRATVATFAARFTRERVRDAAQSSSRLDGSGLG